MIVFKYFLFDSMKHRFGVVKGESKQKSKVNERPAMDKIASIIPILLFPMLTSSAYAACKWVWVDHDYNTSTPAIQKQVCDSTIDIPAIRTPSIRPIQQPQIQPIQTPSIPPIGTRRCSLQSVLENGRWVSKQICD